MTGGIAGEAERWHGAGFNVVPVRGKRPLLRWSSRWRPRLEEVLAQAGRADGLALVAGPVNPYGEVSDLVIIDVDDPRALSRSPTLRRLVRESVSWLTGPRCPRCLREHGPGEAKRGESMKWN